MRGNGQFALDTKATGSAATRHAQGAHGAQEAAEGKVKFAVSQRQLDPRTNVVAVEGELDLASAPKLKWALADVLGAGCRQLVLDLSGVTFIDSTALGVLVGVHRTDGFAVVRYLPSGRLDRSFGTDGRAVTVLGARRRASAFGIAPRSSGGAVAAD